MSEQKEEVQQKVPSEAGDTVDVVVDGINKSTSVTPPLISCPKRHREIIGHLNDKWNAATIRDQLGLSNSTMKTYLSRMRRAGLIDKKNRILIDIARLEVPSEDLFSQTTLAEYESSKGNEGGVDLKRTSIADGNRDVIPIRTAICKMKFELLERPHPLVLAGWQRIGLRNNEQFHTSFEGMYLMLTTKSLLVELPSMDVQGAQDSIALAAKIAPALIESLENQFAGLKLRSISNGVQIVSPRHYAFQDHPFARWLLKKGIVLNSGSIHVDASKPDMRAELEITDEEVKLSPEQHADAYKRQVIDQMQPETPLVSEVSATVQSLSVEMQQMRAAMNDCTTLLKSTVDVQKLTAEQLQVATRLLLPKVEPQVKLASIPFYIG